MIITVDGPAAAGKGTICSDLAQKYKLAYFDTGMIYRAVGLLMVLNNFDLNDAEKAEEFAENLTFQQMTELAQNKDFRSAVGSNAASVISAFPKVRSALLKMQQNFALNPVFADGAPALGVVYDGRDTGTVVCPNADLKLFVTASQEVRAKRRYDEYVAKGIKTTYDEVLSDMQKRDERDANRGVAQMRPAQDAVIIDTSLLDIPAVLAKIYPLIDDKL